MNKPGKHLIEFVKAHNLKLAKVRYKHQFGYCKRKGWDILNEHNHILASFEPIEFSDARWYLRNRHAEYTGLEYVKSISKSVLRDIDPKGISFMTNSKPDLYEIYS